MFASLTLLGVLSAVPAQGGLEIKDVRLTHGVLGPARAAAKVLPGDHLVVAFDVEGVSTDPATGKVLYSTGVEILDGKGTSLFKQPVRDLEAINSLGGGRLPAYSQMDVGLEAPAGTYTMKVTVTDRTSKKSQSFEQKVEVLPKAFGVVRVHLSGDHDGNAPVGLVGAGEHVFVNFQAVNFGRDAASKQPKIELELTVLDESGKPTLSKPFTGKVDSNVASNAVSVPMQFQLSLNRPGKFTVQLKATDQTSGKTATESFPLNVLSGR